MLRMNKLILPILMLGVVSCSDTNAPVLDDAVPSNARASLNHLRWAGGAPTFTARVSSPAGEIEPFTPQYGALLSDGGADYTVSFWAVRGQEREITVYYDDVDDATYSSSLGQFLELEITEPVAMPDGTPIAVGDSVLITVTIDSEYLIADLQPSGIQFGSNFPTELELSYGHADGDFDGDGDVDADDADILEQLGMWVQEDVTDPWFAQPAEHDVADKKFESFLEHFSDYAISW